jgi:hypothetical protein
MTAALVGFDHSEDPLQGYRFWLIQFYQLNGMVPSGVK